MLPVTGSRNKEETMKRHNRKNYWLVSLALCILMVFTLLPIAAFAAEYPYQYPAEKPYYE